MRVLNSFIFLYSFTMFLVYTVDLSHSDSSKNLAGSFSSMEKALLACQSLASKTNESLTSYDLKMLSEQRRTDMREENYLIEILK